MEEVEVDLSAPISSTSSGALTGEEQGADDFVKGVHSGVPTDKSSSSSCCHPNPNEDFINKNEVYYNNNNPNSDDQDSKTMIDDTIGREEVEVDELIPNPFDIDNIVEILLKNMKMDDLKKARLVNNTWNKNAAYLLSTSSKQSTLKAKSFTYDNDQYSADLTNTVEILRKSENIKIFRKFEFGTNTSLNRPLFFDHQTYPQIFEIVEMTQPTEITFMADVFHHNLGVQLFSKLFIKFLQMINQHIVHFKIHICVSKNELLVEEEGIYLEFPKLKTLEIEALDKKTYKFMKMLVKNCHFLNKIKFHRYGDMEETVDEFLPDLLTPEIAQNLQKLHLGGSAFEFGSLVLDPLVKSKLLNLKSFKVDTIQIFPEIPITLNYEFQDLLDEPFLKFPQIKSFLTSQGQSLEKLSISFNFFDGFYMGPEFQPIVGQNQFEDPYALDIPRLENLKTLKLSTDWLFLNTRQTQFWPVKSINLPALLPNLIKIEFTYDSRWKMSFVADKPCQTVEELVLKDWSKKDLIMLDLVSLFPNVKYLKLNFYDYHGEDKIQANLSSIEGWSVTLKMIDVRFEKCFPQDFNFQGLSCLSNLEHLYLYQKMKNQNEIHPDFTPLFNMKFFSKLVIKNIKISDDVIVLFEKFPSKLDYTF